MSPDHAALTTLDGFLGGRLSLRQPVSGHRSGTDAMLLATTIPGDAKGELLDLGAGAGAAGLAAAIRCPGLRATLVEIDSDLAALASANITDNGLSDRASVVHCDALVAAARRKAGLQDGRADFVIANPPWLTPGKSRASPDGARALAHVERSGSGTDAGVAGWVRAMAALVRPGGGVAMIHRADALAGVLAAFEGRFGGVRILPVHPRVGEAAIRVVVSGRRGSRAPLEISPGLALHSLDGKSTAVSDEIHRGNFAMDIL